MEVFPSKQGYAIIDENGQLVGIYPDEESAVNQLHYLEWTWQLPPGADNTLRRKVVPYAPQTPIPSLSSPPIRVSAPPGAEVPKPTPKAAPKPPPQAAPKTLSDKDIKELQEFAESWRFPTESPVQGALERSRQAPVTALDSNPPSWKVGKRGKDYVLFENGTEIARFKDEDTAIEHMNYRKYDWHQRQAAPAPQEQQMAQVVQPMAPIGMPPQTRWAIEAERPRMSDKIGAEEWNLPRTRRLDNPWYGEGPEKEMQFFSPAQQKSLERQEREPPTKYAPGVGLVWEKD
jgi:hypothetical protein